MNGGPVTPPCTSSIKFVNGLVHFKSSEVYLTPSWNVPKLFTSITFVYLVPSLLVIIIVASSKLGIAVTVGGLTVNKLGQTNLNVMYPPAGFLIL